MKKLFYTLLLVPTLVLAQSTDQNYVKSTTYKQATTTTVTNPDITTANVQVSYFDGLGRPIQQVAHKQSNSGKDIITHIEYDQYGRQTKEYLPYVSSSASLNYLSSASSDLLNFYASPSFATTGNPSFEATANPFSEKQLENSPLNRVFKQAAPGNPWAMGQGKEIKFDYQTNGFEEVKYFRVTASWDASKGLYNPAIVQTSHYSENQLYKTITKDENWISGNNNTTEEFKDKDGKVVLKRTYNSTPPSGAGGLHDTYYIYDQFGNLTYVIPPLAEGVATQTILDNLGYQYKYDSRNRLVEKKLPGKQWEFIVYDKLDRPVATGPVFSPYGDQSIGWMITQYDVFGRVTQTGWKAMPVSETDRNSNQTTINSGTNPFALDESDILTKNYYDNYNFAGAPSPLPTPVENQTLATNVKGMPTGSWVKVLDNATSTTAEVSYTLYDTKYRPIHTKTTNYLGGYTQVDTHLDWAGKTLYTLTKHKRTSSSTELAVKDMFEYTDQDRLALHKQQINSLPEQLIAKNTYDELGQLISKNVGGEDATGGTSLQTVDYSYNIRGWLKTINDVNTIGNDLFAFKINYNTPETATPLFNGNISETFWKTSTDDIKRKYDYSYDHLNRLLQADYSKEGNTTFNSYLEQLTYDKNGNIQSLIRNGNMDTDGMQFENPIDNLTYLYDNTNKNQLLRVFDATSNTQGFKDDTDGTDINHDISEAPDYAYDANGNMTEDKNKSIESIVYNHLNLPVEIVFPTGKISYLYNAVGQKVRKTVEETGITTTTDYLSGFQYKNAVLQFFPHAEGYVNATESTTKGVGYIFNYVFNYTDHLGNIRLSYSKDPATNVLKIIEENHYYPFGLKHTGYNSDKLMYSKENEKLMLRPVPPLFVTSYSKKYNGQSWETDLGINITAMDYRQYDNALGRFYGIDALSELASMHSPYRFAFNNPVYWSDPSGLFETRKEAREYKREHNIKGKISKQDDGSFVINDKKSGVSYSKGDDSQGYEKFSNDGVTESVIVSREKKSVENQSNQSNTLDNVNFFNDRIKDGADILGATNNKGGSFRLTNNGSYNPRNFSYRFYGSNWTGGSRAGIKTFNVSKVIKNGSIATTVVLGTIEIGQGVSQDYENYQSTGYTNGKNTAVATAKVGAGVGVGWGVGVLTGMAYGATMGSSFPIVGTIIGTVVGGVAGYYASKEAGKLVEKAYE